MCTHSTTANGKKIHIEYMHAYVYCIYIYTMLVWQRGAVYACIYMLTFFPYMRLFDGCSRVFTLSKPRAQVVDQGSLALNAQIYISVFEQFYVCVSISWRKFH